MKNTVRLGSLTTLSVRLWISSLMLLVSILGCTPFWKEQNKVQYIATPIDTSNNSEQNIKLKLINFSMDDFKLHLSFKCFADLKFKVKNEFLTENNKNYSCSKNEVLSLELIWLKTANHSSQEFSFVAENGKLLFAKTISLDVADETDLTPTPTATASPTAIPSASPTATITPTATPTPTSNPGSGSFSIDCKNSAPMIWVFHGQSNMQGEASRNNGEYPGMSLPASVAKEFRLGSGNGFEINYDEANNGGFGEWFNGELAASKKHSLAWKFASTFNAKTQRPLVLLSATRGATAITFKGDKASANQGWYWMDYNGPFYKKMIEKINAARNFYQGRKVYVLLYNGEYDAWALNNGSMTQTEFEGLYQSYLKKIYADTNNGVVAFFAPMIHSLSINGSFNVGLNQLRDAQKNIEQSLINENAPFKFGFSKVYDSFADTTLWQINYHDPDSYVHLNASGYDRVGEQAALSIFNSYCR